MACVKSACREMDVEKDREVIDATRRETCRVNMCTTTSEFLYDNILSEIQHTIEAM